MLASFMLNVDKLMNSELMASSTGDEFKAAFTLWCKAWKQVPAGSLPNNERALASFSGAGARWAKVRGLAMHGFVLCSDQRFYHPILCAEAVRAAKAHAQHLKVMEQTNLRVGRFRARQAASSDEAGQDANKETRYVTQDVTGYVTRRDVDVDDKSSSLRSEDAPSPKSDPDPPSMATDQVRQFVADWNAMAADCGLPKVDRLTDQRRRSITARLGELGPEGWAAALAKIRGSPFLLGQHAGRDFKATFDWVLKPANLTKILEGNYDPKPHNPSPAGKQSAFDAILAGAHRAIAGG
jgi:hypothetical protein